MALCIFCEKHLNERAHIKRALIFWNFTKMENCPQKFLTFGASRFSQTTIGRVHFCLFLTRCLSYDLFVKNKMPKRMLAPQISHKQKLTKCLLVCF